jgi:hypothetical protein
VPSAFSNDFGFAASLYSEKLVAGTKHLASGFSHPRQCGEFVFRMFVTAAPPNWGGPGIPQRAIASSRSPFFVRTIGASQSGKMAGSGGRFPTWLLRTRNRAIIAAWFVVIEYKLHTGSTYWG